MRPDGVRNVPRVYFRSPADPPFRFMILKIHIQFMFRIGQRFIRAFTIFIGAFLRLLLAIILVAPIVACRCETRLRSVKRRSAERGREVYIIEAHGGSTNSSSDGGSKEEPAGHLG